MKLAFDFTRSRNVEFGVGKIDKKKQRRFWTVPIADKVVPGMLNDMVESTWHDMENFLCNGQSCSEPRLYEPTEKYGPTEYVTVPKGYVTVPKGYVTVQLEKPWDEELRKIHQACNRPEDPDRKWARVVREDAEALHQPQGVFCYFVALKNKDEPEHRLTAVRRASQFKGLIKSRLLCVPNEAKPIRKAERIFKLDRDFDILIDDEHTHIWRPSGFKVLARLNEVIISAATGTIDSIGSDLPFIDFSSVKTYVTGEHASVAGEHSKGRIRAAKLVASIKNQILSGITQDRLLKLCERSGVAIDHGADGRVSPKVGNEMQFLELLDRRRYEVELVPSVLERYKASSRTKL